jgi:DNA polymerase-3 subunit alpha
LADPVVQLKPVDYVHLHNHTHYSVLDGLQKVPEMLDRSQALGMEAIAVTDHGTLSGAVEFYKEAKARNIKPIIGIETYVAARTIADKDPVKDKARYHLILLAMNNKGYENLMRLSTIANLDGFYYKARIDHDLLQKYNEGLICLSGCASGELGENFLQGQDEKAYEAARWYKQVFGDRYYIEVQDHGHAEHQMKWESQERINTKLIKLAEDLDIPAVVTCDAHYANQTDKDAHEILLCVQTGSFLSDQDRMSLKDFDLFVEDPKKIIERWGKTHPQFIANTKAIADRCNVELKLSGYLIPKFEVPNGETEKSYLDKLVFRGLAERYGGLERQNAEKLTIDQARKKLTPEVLNRADYELGVVDGMGFNGYFLIVQDFINWGKDNGIVFGPGRGSAAGSVMSYGLRITDLDPLKYELVFERFLNPDRVSMPDIDIDIQDTRREEVIKYCTDKYGADRVANIVTFGKMAARAAVRDVARVLEVPYNEADRLAKMIPPPIQGRHIPLKITIEKEPEVKKEYETNPTAKKVYDLAIRLEGTIRSHGVHAAGVVIAPDELVKFVPLEMAQKGVVATQYAMGPVDELGLLKIDFLGLANLSIVKNAMRIVKKVYGVEIDLANLVLDDPQVYELLGRGDTTGVFQFESAGMKRYLKELKPSVFDDIIAMGALYRPGPMQFIDSYIARKHGREKTAYLHPKMESALSPTYGILVYQEQVMQIARELCGFTGGQADTLRKGVAKKKPEVLAALKKDFIEGALKNSDITERKIEEFWKSLEAFAAYCFPKAHAACYGTTSYWTAYLKAHYPAAFMAALMTSDQDDTDRLSIEIAECKHMGLTVLTPDINQSFAEFAVVPETNEIRFGMNAVKNVGANAVEEILRAREEGQFKSLEDFLRRVNIRIVNRKNLESLLKAGAFDGFGSRSDLMYNLDNLLAYASKVQKQAAEGQTDLFGDMLSDMIPPLSLEPSPVAITDHEQLQWERELLGLYLSSHPLDKYDAYFAEQVMPISQLTKEMDGKQAKIGGVISTIRSIQTKNGSKMAFVKVEDKTGEMEAIIFPNLFEQVGDQLAQDVVVRIKGKLNSKDRDGRITEDLKLIADEVVLVTPAELDGYASTGKNMKLPKASPTSMAAAANPKGVTVSYQPVDTKPVPKPRLYVHVKDPDDHDTLLKLKQTFNQYPGGHEVVLVLGPDKKSAMRMPFTVDPLQELQNTIAGLFGADCVALK